MSAQSRKHRGYATQRLLADRWNQSGFMPGCYPIGAGEAGADIQRTPGLEVEVKAQGDRMSLPAAVRQAAARALPGTYPIVVWRHPGQGPASIGEWTVTMSLDDFERLFSGRDLER